MIVRFDSRCGVIGWCGIELGFFLVAVNFKRRFLEQPVRVAVTNFKLHNIDISCTRVCVERRRESCLVPLSVLRVLQLFAGDVI